jgi:hypothetical protein
MAFSENLSRISLNLDESEPNVRFTFDCCRPLCARARPFSRCDDDAGSSSSKRGRWRGASARTAESAGFVGKQLVGNVSVLKNRMIC